MSKLAGELSYKDWMIIKHSLKETVEISQSVMDGVDKAVEGLDESQYTVDAYKKQKKELEEEKATLERVIKLTDNFKKYIKGKEHHYMHRPVNCD
jgi:putative IMPACT (imprinted ancient) family translation regulator